jgi:NAD(P)-dependent dehydrogenase (short-subunit alcohol dehydrogenase family)
MGERFDGKVAVVTGGGDAADLRGVGLGIGATISELLAAEGAHVAVIDRDRDLAALTVGRIEAAGGTAVAVPADVGNEADCRNAAEQALEAYGRLDVLVNNVGIESYPRSEDGTRLERGLLLSEVAEEDWDRTMDINVKGMMLMAKHAAPHFAPGAAIVNIGSLAALQPHRGTSAYATSKAAVVGLTIAMAVDLAPTRANCVSPGQAWTPAVVRKLGSDPEQIEAIRAERLGNTLVGTEGTALDIAEAVAFLASAQGRWITGQHLVVDGGFSLYGNAVSSRSSGWTVDALR